MSYQPIRPNRGVSSPNNSVDNQTSETSAQSPKIPEHLLRGRVYYDENGEVLLDVYRDEHGNVIKTPEGDPVYIPYKLPQGYSEGSGTYVMQGAPPVGYGPGGGAVGGKSPEALEIGTSSIFLTTPKVLLSLCLDFTFFFLEGTLVEKIDAIGYRILNFPFLPPLHKGFST